MDILDGAVKLYRDNFWTLLTINAIVHVPVRLAVAVTSWFGGSVTADPENMEWDVYFGAMAATLGLALLLAGLEPFLQGVVSYAVAEQYLGRQTSVFGAYRGALRRFWYLVGSVILAVIIKQVGFLMCVLPGLIALVWLMFSPICVVVEGADPITSLKRSYALVRGRDFQIFGLYVLVWFFFYFAQYAVTMLLVLPGLIVFHGDVAEGYPASDSVLLLWVQMAGGLAWAIVTPVVHTAVVLMYFDQRVRKEGFDVQAALPALGEDALTFEGQPQQAAAADPSRPAPTAVPPPPPQPAPAGQSLPPPVAPASTPVRYGAAQAGTPPPAAAPAAPAQPRPCPSCGRSVPAQLRVCPGCLYVLRPEGGEADQ
jgi:hypothetical protein